jgi:hypothetical protein
LCALLRLAGSLLRYMLIFFRFGHDFYLSMMDIFGFALRTDIDDGLAGFAPGAEHRMHSPFTSSVRRIVRDCFFLLMIANLLICGEFSRGERSAISSRCQNFLCLPEL